MKSKTNPPHQIALLLALITFLIRFVYIFNFLSPHQYIKWMPYQNHTRAQQVLEKGQAFYGNAWGSYYLVLAGQYKLYSLLGITDTTTAAIITHIILASITVFFFYLLASRLFTRTGLVSSVLLMLYYPAIYFNALLLAENLFLTLVIIFFYLYIPPPRRQSPEKNKLKSALAGLLLGLATVIRPILLPFLPLLIIWYLLRFKTKNKQPIFTTLATLILILFGFILLNQRFSSQNKFQLSASTGVNFAMTQCNIKKITYKTASNESYWFSPPIHWNTDFEAKTTSIPFYHQAYYFNMGLQCLRQNPRQLITNFTHVKNVFSSIFYPEYKPISYFSEFISFWKYFSLASFILFFLYPITNRQKPKYLLRVYLPFVLFFFSLFLSVYLANPGEERYLIPYAWIFFLFAPKTVYNLIKNFKNHP